MTGKVQISNHAANQYIERINRNLFAIEDEKARIAKAKEMVALLLEESITKGVVSRNEAVKVDLIVRDGVVVTLYPIAGKWKKRRKYAKSA